jgi:hypothetical protein
MAAELGGERGLVGIVDTGDMLEFADTKTAVETDRIALLADRKWRVYIDFHECADVLAGCVAGGSIWRYRGD